MAKQFNGWSPAGLIIDLYDDLFLGTVRADEKLAEDLGDMKVLDVDELAKLADEQFALVIETPRRRLRKFPIHEVHHVKVAAVYLLQHGDKLPPAARKLASDNITIALKRELGDPAPHFENIYRTYADNDLVVKTAAPAEYALVKEANNKVERLYPCSTPSNCERSMEHFEQQGMGRQPAERRKIALSLYRRAQEFDIAARPDGLVARYAAEDWNPQLRLCLEERKEALDRDVDVCRVLDELAENVTGFSKEAVVKLLETFDSHYGLDRCWGKRDYPDPYVTVYGHAVTKTAVDIKGLGSIEPQELQKIAETEGLLEGIVGDDGAEMFREDPETVFASLPRPTQTYLVQRIRE